MNRKKLVIASNNPGKIAEIKTIFYGVYDEIRSLADENIDIEVDETGETFEQNAKLKSEAISRIVSGDVLGDDSGLCVDALGGAPGVYSARYSGAGNAANIELLLKNMQGVHDRTARFVCCLSLANGGQEFLAVRGECVGEIVKTPAGENGFGYDPIFYMKQFGRTFAEMTAEEKNEVSHRENALEKCAEILNSK